MFITEERLIELCGNDPKYQEKSWLLSAMESELEEYNDYINGNVYGFETYTLEMCNCCHLIHKNSIDSTLGYYGNNFKKNGLLKAAGWNNY